MVSKVDIRIAALIEKARECSNDYIIGQMTNNKVFTCYLETVTDDGILICRVKGGREIRTKLEQVVMICHARPLPMPDPVIFENNHVEEPKRTTLTAPQGPLHEQH